MLDKIFPEDIGDAKDNTPMPYSLDHFLIELLIRLHHNTRNTFR